MKLKNRSYALLAGAAAIAVAAIAIAQPPGGGFAGGFADRMSATLAEPFVGMLNNGEKQEGLFSIAPTGASTAQIGRAHV